jgi:hypothetical protein
MWRTTGTLVVSGVGMGIAGWAVGVPHTLLGSIIGWGAIIYLARPRLTQWREANSTRLAGALARLAELRKPSRTTEIWAKTSGPPSSGQ